MAHHNFIRHSCYGTITTDTIYATHTKIFQYNGLTTLAVAQSGDIDMDGYDIAILAILMVAHSSILVLPHLMVVNDEMVIFHS
jgi:hypothetical protein